MSILLIGDYYCFFLDNFIQNKYHTNASTRGTFTHEWPFKLSENILVNFISRVKNTDDFLISLDFGMRQDKMINI